MATLSEIFKLFVMIALCVGAYFALPQAAKHINDLPPPRIEKADNKLIEITQAGNIKEIQLHETSFSTATTVTTTAGVFQVHGGVSGAVGDEARIEARNSGIFGHGIFGVQKTLCIKSSIKTACYPLK